jgi:hypothetical protein
VQPLPGDGADLVYLPDRHADLPRVLVRVVITTPLRDQLPVLVIEDEEPLQLGLVGSSSAREGPGSSSSVQVERENTPGGTSCYGEYPGG